MEGQKFLGNYSGMNVVKYKLGISRRNYKYGIHPLNTKHRLHYLKTQLVPRSKHFTSVL